ncbi:MAG: DUF1893 domain-containing protein [Lachnospiraceae bacterium]|nr:DUF1893 domain-containing protein [Lachnospiraceae bacterium]
MDENLNRAREILINGGYTCVIIKDDIEYNSKERGVKPLLDWTEQDINFEDAYVSDKVVGKAAAFLYVLMKVKAIYAIVLSQHAYEVLQRYGIAVSYDSIVPAIRNRDNTGFCPMESSVMGINDPTEAKERIEATRVELLKKRK